MKKEVMVGAIMVIVIIGVGLVYAVVSPGIIVVSTTSTLTSTVWSNAYVSTTGTEFIQPVVTVTTVTGLTTYTITTWSPITWTNTTTIS